MEEKMFELMEKMYVEFSKKFEKIDERFVKIDERFENMEQGLRQEIKQESARLENVLGAKIDALRDGYTQNEVRLTKVENRLTEVEDVIRNKSIVVGKDYYIQLFPKTKEPA